jgi:Protein of unknown function (DUF3618)
MTSRGFQGDITAASRTDTSDAEAIAADIEMTRDAMSETIDSIQQRIDPERLSEQAISTASEVTIQARDAAMDVTKYAIEEAKSAVRELADQATSAVRASTVGRIEEMAAYTRGTAQTAQSDFVSVIKQNPIPAALAAVSLGWLWSHRSGGSYGPGYSASGGWVSDWETSPRYGSGIYGIDSGRPDDATGQARQMAGQVLDQAQQRAGIIQGKAEELKEQVGQIPGQVPMRASQVQEQAQGFWQMLEANPIAVGAVGAVLGGIVGLMLPETEQEQRLMGETRDQVIGSVQDVAGQTLDKVQQVAKEAATAAADEAKSQGVMPKSGSGSSAIST